MFKTFAKAIQSLSVALLVCLPMAVSAQQLSENASIVVESPWARASLGMSRPGAAYLTVRNEGSDPISLIGLRTEISGMASIH